MTNLYTIKAYARLKKINPHTKIYEAKKQTDHKAVKYYIKKKVKPMAEYQSASLEVWAALEEAGRKIVIDS